VISLWSALIAARSTRAWVSQRWCASRAMISRSRAPAGRVSRLPYQGVLRAVSRAESPWRASSSGVNTGIGIVGGIPSPS
jgi:hypothetical protein